MAATPITASGGEANGVCAVGRVKHAEYDRRIGLLESKLDRMQWLMVSTLASAVASLFLLLVR